MAKFMDLSNELVIVIASFIRKPADILQLCIAERRSHDMIVPLLYKDIVLHHLDYPTDKGHNLSSSVNSLCWLLNHQDQNERSGNDFGRGCRSLNITFHHRTMDPADSVIELISFLPFLRDLSFISGRRPPYDCRREITFPRGDLEQVLRPLRGTLETLTLFIDRVPECFSKDGIGSLHRFKAMKQLRIQSRVLLGFGDGKENSGLSLSQLLPPNLEDLTIHCCEFDIYHDISDVDHFETRIDGEVSAPSFGSSQGYTWMDRRVIENVVVCMQGANVPLPRLAVGFHSRRLASCFDIVGKNMDSADEN